MTVSCFKCKAHIWNYSIIQLQNKFKEPQESPEPLKYHNFWKLLFYVAPTQVNLLATNVINKPDSYTTGRIPYCKYYFENQSYPLRGNILLKNCITTVYFIILFHLKTQNSAFTQHTTQHWFSNAHVPFLLKMGDAQPTDTEFPKMSLQISKSFTEQRVFSWIKLYTLDALNKTNACKHQGNRY